MSAPRPHDASIDDYMTGTLKDAAEGKDTRESNQE